MVTLGQGAVYARREPLLKSVRTLLAAIRRLATMPEIRAS